MQNAAKDALACSTCSKTFNTTTKQPHLLHCFHTFCQECLQTMAKPHTPSSSPTSQFSITCPLCSKVTPCSSASSLPINYALNDLVLASAAMVQDGTCDIHEVVHSATYWCFDCEQYMCDEAHTMHSRTRGTGQHQTSKLGTQPQVIRKQVLCSAHGKELDLVCTDDSHAPRMVCISCVVTTHRSHSCVTTAEYFAEKQEEMHALLARAQVYEARVEKGAEVVEKERGSIASNRDTVAGQINFFFNREISSLKSRRNRMLTELAASAINKEKVLLRQVESLLATLDGIQNASSQLQTVLQDFNSKAKSILMMEQLQQHLQSIEEVDLQLQEKADIGFYEIRSIFYRLSPDVYLVDGMLSESTIMDTNGSFPIVLSSRVASSWFDTSSTTAGKRNKLKWNITSTANGKYSIQPNVICFGEQSVEVKLFGEHVKGSPLKMQIKPSWSSTNTVNTIITSNKMEAEEEGAWGMIQEVFGLSRQSLTISIAQPETDAWFQVSLNSSSTVQLESGKVLHLNSSPSYCSNQKVGNVSILKLQREDDGQVALYHDDKFIWRVRIPACYVYVDVYYPTSVVEILQ